MLGLHAVPEGCESGFEMRHRGIERIIGVCAVSGDRERSPKPPGVGFVAEARPKNGFGQALKQDQTRRRMVDWVWTGWEARRRRKSAGPSA